MPRDSSSRGMRPSELPSPTSRSRRRASLTRWHAVAPTPREPFQTWQPASARGSRPGAPARGGRLLPRPGPERRVLHLHLRRRGPLDGRTPPAPRVLPQGGPGRGRKRTFLLQEVRVGSAPRMTSTPSGDRSACGLRGPRAASSRTPVGPDTPRPARRGVDVPGVLDGDPRDRLVASGGMERPRGPGRRWRKASGRTMLLQQESRRARENRTLGSFRLGLAASFDGDATLVPDDWRAASHARSTSTGACAPECRRWSWRSASDSARDETLPPRLASSSRVRWSPRRSCGARPERIPPPGDRLAFARWIAAPENALMRRVTLNRWWSYLFGRGIVETIDDFGVRGARPSHPELLEWLAGEMLASGDSRRHVLRQMVMSRTYRQGRRVDPALRDRDPGQRAARSPGASSSEREAIRDAMLVASGRLVARPFGPPVEPPQPPGVFAFTQTKKSWKSPAGEGRYRRSIYTRIWRSSPYPFFGTFDAPGRDASCVRRTSSRTPLQALALVNDPQVMELARELVARLDREYGPDGHGPDGDRIVAAFEWALQRGPSTGGVETRPRLPRNRAQPRRGASSLARPRARPLQQGGVHARTMSRSGPESTPQRRLRIARREVLRAGASGSAHWPSATRSRVTARRAMRPAHRGRSASITHRARSASSGSSWLALRASWSSSSRNPRCRSSTGSRCRRALLRGTASRSSIHPDPSCSVRAVGSTDTVNPEPRSPSSSRTSAGSRTSSASSAAYRPGDQPRPREALHEHRARPLREAELRSLEPLRPGLGGRRSPRLRGPPVRTAGPARRSAALGERVPALHVQRNSVPRQRGPGAGSRHARRGLRGRAGGHDRPDPGARPTERGLAGRARHRGPCRNVRARTPDAVEHAGRDRSHLRVEDDARPLRRRSSRALLRAELPARPTAAPAWLSIRPALPHGLGPPWRSEQSPR